MFFIYEKRRHARKCVIWPILGTSFSTNRHVTRINHEIHFAWQAQYLVKLEGDACCFAHCKLRFICDADQS